MERNMRVLLADRDEVFLDVAQRFLSDGGHEATIATNGLETVANMRRNLPDAVVLDRELLWGGCDGVLALMQQVPEWSEIPLILTSTETMPEDSDSVVGLPVVARLQKPYRLKELAVHLHRGGPKDTPNPAVSCFQGGRPWA
jgi:CheY-like chemotaxis protein